MTTKSKGKKHALNPIIILSFIVISLLFVIITIAMKENIDVNGNLKASVYYCKPNSEVKRVRGEEYVILTETAPITQLVLDASRSEAITILKTQFCANQLSKSENQIPCTDKLCKSKESTGTNPNPRCTATIYSINNALTPPDPSPGADVTIKWTATLNAELRRTCVPTATTSTTPAVYPQCFISGSHSNDCDPNSEGIFKVDNTEKATVTDESLNDNELVSRATAKAIEAAQAGLEAKCAALATNDPMYHPKCTSLGPKACATGCKPHGKSVYKPPYQPIDANGDPIYDPPVRTAPQCTTGILATAPHSITMSATCFAACNYSQDCFPYETLPPPTSPSPTKSSSPTPIR
jgi:hypothetical protein